jgi:hypothetical protein
MPHCKVCGNPVSRDETECSMCGSALKASRRSGQDRRGYGLPSKPRSDYGSSKNEIAPLRTGSSPYLEHDGDTKKSSPIKLMAIILAILVATALITIGFLGLDGTIPLTIDNTPSGTFERVTGDEQTVQTTFGTFDPSTQFSDCGFRISIYFPSQTIYGIIAWHDYYLNCDNYSLNVYFVDIDDNGWVDAGDYCIIHSYNVPLGLQCTIDILYTPTSGTICSAQFSYS